MTIKQLLKQRKWTKADKLSAATGLTKRQLRKIAENSNGEIITSNKGYALTRKCSQQDIEQCARRLLSQATKMQKRVRQIFNQILPRL